MRKITTVLILLLFTGIIKLNACTIFNASQGDSIALVGNNEEWFGTPGVLYVLPPVDTLNGIVAWGFKDMDIQGAMNSKGLFYDGNAVTDPYMPVTVDPNKPEFEFELFVDLMQQCATIHDVLNFIKPYNLSFLNEAQLQFVDASGASVIIEGDSVIHKTDFYQISTNFYQSQVQNPYDEKEEYWRYCYVDSAMQANQGKVTKELMRDLCNATSVSPLEILATGYSNVCDLKNKSIEFYHMRDYENSVTIDLDEYFQKGEGAYNIYDLYHELYPNRKNYNGLWKSDGYGYLLLVDELAMDDSGNKLTVGAVCQYTDKSMLFDLVVYIIDEELFFDGDTDNPIGSIQRDSTNLITADIMGKTLKFKPYELRTMEEFENFQNMIFDDTKKPSTNFEVFWHIYKENCALFELSGVDWQDQYDRYFDKITSNTTQKELFEILSEMIEPLNDGHSYIYGEVMGEEMFFSGGPEIESPIIMNRINEFTAAVDNTLDDGVQYTNSVIAYGTVNGNIGYIDIPAFQGYTFTENGNVEVEVFSEIIDDVFSEFEETSGLIIDLRWNEGGYDQLAIALVQRLLENEIYGFAYQARNGGFNDYNNLQELNIEPSGVSYTDKPVVVLTSNMSASAADFCAMLMNNTELGNVTTMGETTYGIFSDILEMRLPNGWQIGLSNERYFSDEGINYEQKGITPDVVVLPSTDSLDIGIDNMLNEAVRYLINTGITSDDSENSADLLFEIYPNPASIHFTISMNYKVNNPVVMRIYNSIGQSVVSETLNGFNDQNIDISNFKTGIYYIQLVAENQILTKKLIKR